MRDYVHYIRRRQRDMLLARQHLHHLQQYHMKGNPVGNGSVGGRVDRLHRASRSRSTVSVRNQSMLTATSLVVAQNQLDSVASGSKDRQREMEQDQTNNNNNNGSSSRSERHQRRSHVNGNVFYVSGRANTAPCCTTVNHPADDCVSTTFKYLTYDRDYFHERQKSSCLHDRNLRHSMR